MAMTGVLEGKTSAGPNEVASRGGEPPDAAWTTPRTTPNSRALALSQIPAGAVGLAGLVGRVHVDGGVGDLGEVQRQRLHRLGVADAAVAGDAVVADQRVLQFDLQIRLELVLVGLAEVDLDLLALAPQGKAEQPRRGAVQILGHDDLAHRRCRGFAVDADPSGV